MNTERLVRVGLAVGCYLVLAGVVVLAVKWL